MKFGVMGLSPWRRAPLLLWRHPGVVAAIAGSIAVLAAAAAALPLFVSSVGSAAVAVQVSQRCAEKVGTLITSDHSLPATSVPAAAADLAARTDQALTAAGARPADLLPPSTVALADVSVTSPNNPGLTEALQLVSRRGAPDHVHKVASIPGPGLWITDTLATELHLRPGDRVVLGQPGTAAGGRSIAVAGVYRDMEGRAIPAWWCSLQDVIGKPGLTYPPPSLGILDQSTLLSLTGGLGEKVDLWVERGADGPRLSLSDTRRVVSSFGRLARGPVAAVQAFHGSGAPFLLQVSDLPFVAGRAAAIQATVRSAVTPVTVAGLVVALVLVAAAGSYWVDRRRVELDLLTSRGVGPSGLGLKACLETAPLTVLGGAVGWAVARGLVRALGPSPVLDRGVAAHSLLPAAAVTLVGLALIGVVAAVRVRARTERPVGSRPGRASRVPWELGLTAVALAALVRAGAGGLALSAAGSIPGSPPSSWPSPSCS